MFPDILLLLKSFVFVLYKHIILFSFKKEIEIVKVTATTSFKTSCALRSVGTMLPARIGRICVVVQEYFQPHMCMRYWYISYMCMKNLHGVQETSYMCSKFPACVG